ncbi:MAG: hypothetical protein U5R49_09105 [Deltaproteobacteria bacterium]|nr:hypothetical protein [Deltaproteobacteria bacterium]
MPENLESFVEKLKSEGVDAGKAAAEKLKKEAEQEAEEIISHAREEAEGILQQAKADAERRHKNAQSELKMAARDAILRLRESLNQALTGLITHRVQGDLEDRDYLREIIRDVISTYAKKDATLEKPVEIDVSEDIPDDWIQETIDDLAEHLQKTEENIQIQASLKGAGFDYQMEDGTVEVSPDSVTELLLEMVNPRLQEIISQAMADGPDESS